MKGKELNVEFKEKTQEEIAKKVIEEIQEVIMDRKTDLKEAEDKLSEILDKDINDIKKEDSRSYNF